MLMPTSLRGSIVTLGLLFGALATPGCSSKPAETDTAEVVPDPAVRPAPAPAPTTTPVVSSDAAPSATTPTPEAKP